MTSKLNLYFSITNVVIFRCNLGFFSKGLFENKDFKYNLLSYCCMIFTNHDNLKFKYPGANNFCFPKKKKENNSADLFFLLQRRVNKSESN